MRFIHGIIVLSPWPAHLFHFLSQDITTNVNQVIDFDHCLSLCPHMKSFSIQSFYLQRVFRIFLFHFKKTFINHIAFNALLFSNVFLSVLWYPIISYFLTIYSVRLLLKFSLQKNVVSLYCSNFCLTLDNFFYYKSFRVFSFICDTISF